MRPFFSLYFAAFISIALLMLLAAADARRHADGFRLPLA